MPRATFRGHRGARREFQGQDSHQVVPGPITRRADLGLPRAAAGAAGSELGAFHVEKRFSPDRVWCRSVQLVSVSGKLDRSRPLRMDAPELERAAARRSRTVRAKAPQA